MSACALFAHPTLLQEPRSRGLKSITVSCKGKEESCNARLPNIRAGNRIWRTRLGNFRQGFDSACGGFRGREHELLHEWWTFGSSDHEWRYSAVKVGSQGESGQETEPLNSVASTENAVAAEDGIPSIKGNNMVAVDDISSAEMNKGSGKSGFITFHRSGSGRHDLETSFSTSKSRLSMLWLLGPLVLTTSVFLPPMYLRTIFGSVLSDSLATDFVILIFTETLFFIGASVFLYIAHQVHSPAVAENTGESFSTINSFGYRALSIISLGIGLILPIVTFSMVWPWTGPAAVAALAPYTVGLLVQMSLEKIARRSMSPASSLIPIIFQIYRFHQLNRASQLISGLLYSLKGLEATVETMAINGSLQTLQYVLKFLGVVCIISLGTFLTHQGPARSPLSH